VDPLVDDPRIFHVAFHEFSRDPIGTVGKAYAQWDLPFTHDFEARMQAWLADPANSANRYGRYDYRFEPFGLSGGVFEAPGLDANPDFPYTLDLRRGS